MSSPAEFYNSLPPITRAYGTACLLTTVATQIRLLDPAFIAHIPELSFFSFQDFMTSDLRKGETGGLDIHRYLVDKNWEGVFNCSDQSVDNGTQRVWRLVTNFFFLGPFSINFGIRLLMIARYGVQLENGPFNRRTADFLWMMIFGALTLLVLSAIPFFWSPFLGISLVFMLLYLWSREFPNANINIYGLVSLKAFYFPWAMLCLDVIFGSPIVPDLLGIIAGHLYYFLTVLHPLAGGKTILTTPRLIHKLITRFRIGAPTTSSNAPQPEPTSVVFRGRSHRLGR